MEWTLEDIRAKARKLTGRPSTSQLSTADLDDYINNYYQNVLPDEISLEPLKDWFSFQTVGGQGEYYVPDLTGGQNVNFMTRPLTVDGVPVEYLHFDPELFFGRFPRDQETSDYWGTPSEALFYGATIYLRPIPSAVHTIKLSSETRPAAMTTESSGPVIQKWGMAIAYGAAIDILLDGGDVERAASLSQVLAGSLMPQIYRQQTRLYDNCRAVPRF